MVNSESIDKLKIHLLPCYSPATYTVGKKNGNYIQLPAMSFPQREPGIQKTMCLMSHIKPYNKQMTLQVPTEFMLKLAMQICTLWPTVLDMFLCDNLTLLIYIQHKKVFLY